MISLSRAGEIWRLNIKDNGRGCQNEASGSPQRHYGITGMRERASRIGTRLLLSSSPGAGTEASLQIAPKDLLRTSPVKKKA